MRMKLYNYTIQTEIGSTSGTRYWNILEEVVGKEYSERLLNTYEREAEAIEGLAFYEKKEEKRRKKNRQVRLNRVSEKDLLDGLGLTKVKGAISGKTYYE